MLSDCFLGLSTAVSHQWLDELGEAERREIAAAYDTVPAARPALPLKALKGLGP